jgi:small subunit ribosomal protein S8
MVGDPIGDFITRLMNAGAVKKTEVELPYSRMKHTIADKLVALGYLKSAQKRGKKVKKNLAVELIYEAGQSRIRGVSRISKPGRRLYASVNEIRPIRFGKGKLILSTPKGIMSGEEAREANVGGEKLFSIW